MNPAADAPAAAYVADSELDTYADSDAQPPSTAAPMVPVQPTPRKVAERDVAEPEVAESVPADVRAQPAPAAPGLTEREQRILAFERQWWRHAGAKEQAIRDTFQLSATRYYQVLNNLLDNPAALAADPVLVGRLRRLRTARARSRRR
jgi:Protein of unknown function (DUF3263)